MDDEFFAKNFNTALSKESETAFQKWVATRSKKLGRDLSKDLLDYDLRGYWYDEGYKDTGEGHGPDTYKKPNHPTFSEESKYHGMTDPWGSKWEGGRWVGDDKTGWSFQATDSMLKKTHSRDMLQNYFAEHEPDVMLLMPFKTMKGK